MDARVLYVLPEVRSTWDESPAPHPYALGLSFGAYWQVHAQLVIDTSDSRVKLLHPHFRKRLRCMVWEVELTMVAVFDSGWYGLALNSPAENAPRVISGNTAWPRG